MISGYGKYTVTSSQKGSLQTTLNGGYRGSSSARRSQVTASTIGLAGQNSIGSITGFGKNVQTGIIEDITGSISEHSLRNMFRDIYYHDAICGSVVDLLSNIPFDDFSLQGVNDPSVLKVYMQSVENLNVRTLMPSLTVDYLVLGAFIATLGFNKSSNIFDSIIPHNIDDCKVTPNPIFGGDPIIDLTVSKELTSMLHSKDERVLEAVQKFPESFRAGIAKGKVALDPASTIYLYRRSFSSHQVGISLYRRILPIYFLEKAMLRGTIESASRRQRGILHLQVGDDTWEPTSDNLADLANLFQQADSDPLNAIVATRMGIQTNEIREGNAFWRYDEIYEMASSWKLRAMGVNEAFVSGESNFNTLEQTLSVLMEQIRSYRSYITRSFFNEKLFPGIAAANNFKKDTKNIVTGNAQNEYSLHNGYGIHKKNGKYIAECGGGLKNYIPEIKDITEYQIPDVVWHKQLRPEADTAYMDMLTHVTEMGIPVPLRMIAAAGGVNLDKVLAGEEEDLDVRSKIADYISRINESSQGQGYAEQGSIGKSGIKRMKIKDRFKEGSEEYNFKRNKGGHKVPMSSRERKMLDEKLNRQLAKFMGSVKPISPFGTNR